MGIAMNGIKWVMTDEKKPTIIKIGKINLLRTVM
jgi:hypothetical protein